MRSLKAGPIEYNYSDHPNYLLYAYYKLVEHGFARFVPSGKLFHRKLMLTEWGEYYVRTD